MIPRRLMVAASLCCLSLPLSSTAAQITSTWQGGTGDYDVPGNWDTGQIPDNNVTDTFVVRIDGGNAAAATVSLDTNPTIDSMEIDAGEALLITDGAGMSVVAGDVSNDGSIQLSGTTTDTSLSLQGSASISGTGNIVLNSSDWDTILSDNSIITHSSGHTIRGAGKILNGTGGMINQGQIIADIPGGVLILQPDGNGFTNGTLLRATGGGFLALYNGSFLNSGIIEALNDSFITINLATVSGGSMHSAGTGMFDLFQSPTLENVASDAFVVVQDEQTATLLTSFANDGTIAMDGSIIGTVAGSTLNLADSCVVSGSGEISLGTYPENVILSDGSIAVQEAGHKIRGTGKLLNGTGGMINRGQVIADTPGSILVIEPDENGFTNESLLSAVNSGVLALSNGSFSNSGTVEALDQSVTYITLATVTGGTLHTAGTGMIDLFQSPTLENVSSDAYITIQDEQAATLLTSFDNDGVVELNGSAIGSIAGATLNLMSDCVLSGSGEISLGTYSGNAILGDGSVVIQETDHSIRGSGKLLNGTTGMKNLGQVIADTPGTPLIVEPDGNGFTNESLLQATSGGMLVLYNGGFPNSGTIEALTDSVVTINQATITGGLLQTQGTGMIDVIQNPTLENVAADAFMVIQDEQSASLLSSITNDGMIFLDGSIIGSSAGSTVHLLNSCELSGSGEILLSGYPENALVADMTTVTQQAGHTIRGAGKLLDGTGGLLNLGTIIAEESATLTVVPDNNGFENRGNVVVEGVLDLDGAVFQTSGKTILSQLTSELNISGPPLTYDGGTLSGIGTVNGKFFSNGCKVSPGLSAGILNINGDYTQSTGTLEIEVGGLAAGSQYDQLAVTGSVAIDGTLHVRFVNGFVPALNDTFTVITRGADGGGAFETITYENLPPYITMAINYQPGFVEISVASVPVELSEFIAE